MSKLFILKGKNGGVPFEFKLRVDDEYAYLLRSYLWRVNTRDFVSFEVTRNLGYGTRQALAHEILQVPAHEIIRFKNQDCRDFQKENLYVPRFATHCRKGHELTPENTYKDNSKRGTYCRKCNDLAQFKCRAKVIFKELEAA